MNVETAREYCLSLPLSTEDFPFDDSVLAFRVEGKVFAMIDLEDTEWFVMKCQPEYSLELRDAYPEIKPAWHMNKKHWNQVSMTGFLTDELIQSLIRHSYKEVVKKLPKKIKETNPVILTVKQ